MAETAIRSPKQKLITIVVWFSVWFIVIVIGLLLVLIKTDRQHKKTIIKFYEELQEVKQERNDIIETAFYVRDVLLSDYYIGDAKKFESFMLIGVQFIMKQETVAELPVKQRMNKQIKSAFLETIYVGANAVGIDPMLILAIDSIESNFNRFAVSSAGAVGIPQLMPATAKLVSNTRVTFQVLEVGSYEYRKLNDPIWSTKIQIIYLKHLFDTFDGRVEWVLFAYNWGPDYVLRKWWNNGIMVFKDLPIEQSEYAQDVIAIYNTLK